MKRPIYPLALVVFIAFGLTGCDSLTGSSAESAELTPPEVTAAAPLAISASKAEPRKELARARAATARYQQVENALADGYVDIGVVVPGQGHHYLNPALLDETFDVERPELLLYTELPNGRLKLVGVEYAVPLTLSEDAPEGFTGDEDEWDVNTEFGLWVLHAWIWLGNPNGVFAHANPLVP